MLLSSSQRIHENNTTRMENPQSQPLVEANSLINDISDKFFKCHDANEWRDREENTYD
jgi:hypothetical protein